MPLQPANDPANDDEQVHELGDEFLLLPKPERPPIVPWALAAGGVAIAAAVFFGTAKPAIEREQKMRTEAAAAALQLEAARREAAAGKEATTELEALRKETAKLREEIAAKGAATDKAADGRLLEQLKSEVGTGKGAEVESDGQRITVTLVDKILFKSGVADLTPDGEQVLGKIGAVLKTIDGKLIEVSGHADNQHVESAVKEKYPTNWELSTARATNVVRYLEERGGISGKRLKAAGFGSSRPVASNRTAQGRAKNRRIEILLLPETKIVKGDFADEIAAATPPAAKPAPAPATKTEAATAKTAPAKQTKLALRTKRKR